MSSPDTEPPPHELRARPAADLTGQLLAPLRRLYGAAYGYPATSERLRRFPQLLEGFADQPGCTAVLAWSPAGRLDGMAFGYTTLPGERWHDFAAEQLPPDTLARAVTGAFGLAQLAVRPDIRGRGLGGRLHDTILNGVPHDRAVLAVAHGNHPAERLYTGRGWQVLLDDFRYPLPHIPEPYRIMTLRLAEEGDANESR